MCLTMMSVTVFQSLTSSNSKFVMSIRINIILYFETTVTLHASKNIDSALHRIGLAGKADYFDCF